MPDAVAALDALRYEGRSPVPMTRLRARWTVSPSPDLTVTSRNSTTPSSTTWVTPTTSWSYETRSSTCEAAHSK